MKKITIIILLLIVSASYSFSYSRYFTASYQQNREYKYTLTINERSSLNFYMLAYRGNPNYTSPPGASTDLQVWARSNSYDWDEIIESRSVTAYYGISATSFQGVAYDPNGRIYKIEIELTTKAPGDYCFLRVWW